MKNTTTQTVRGIGMVGTEEGRRLKNATRHGAADAHVLHFDIAADWVFGRGHVQYN
jgi:hypothetical protein